MQMESNYIHGGDLFLGVHEFVLCGSDQRFKWV